MHRPQRGDFSGSALPSSWQKDMKSSPTSGYMTPGRTMIRELARTFARDEVLPLANRLEPIGQDMPRELTERMGDLVS